MNFKDSIARLPILSGVGIFAIKLSLPPHLRSSFLELARVILVLLYRSLGKIRISVLRELAEGLFEDTEDAQSVLLVFP